MTGCKVYIKHYALDTEVRGQVENQLRKSHLHICLLVWSVAVSKEGKIFYKMERSKEKKQKLAFIKLSAVCLLLYLLYIS